MPVEQYTNEKHFELLKQWLEPRGIFDLTPDMLGHLGYCANNTAIGFLLLSNSPIAWIANWAVDPNANQEDRNTAIALLLNQFEAVAKTAGCKVIQSLAKFDSMKNRFSQRDYQSFGDYTLYSKILGDK